MVKRLTPDSKSAAAINLRLTLTDRHFDNKTGLLKLNCTLTIGRSSNSQFNKSVEHMAALIHPTPVLEPRPTSPERSAKGKDYRSASYSSGKQCIIYTPYLDVAQTCNGTMDVRELLLRIRRSIITNYG